MSGRLGGLSAEQTQMLAQFKEKFAAGIASNSQRFDDIYLLRFLRARKWVFPKACEMFENHLAWFQKNRVATIVEEVEGDKKFETIRSYYPSLIAGVDLDGNPFVIQRMGLVDIKGLLSKYTIADLVRFDTYLQELSFRAILKQRQATGKPIDSLFIVADLTGAGTKHMASAVQNWFKATTESLEANYPETMKGVLVVNAPKIFPVLFNWAKTFVDPQSVAKVDVVGSGKDKIGAKLLAKVAPQFVPAEWGGSGPALPAGGKLSGASDDPLSRTVEVASSLEVPVEVAKDSIISYEFKTQAHDIMFSILFGASRQVVAPSTRYEFTDEPKIGQFKAAQAGVYIFVFDNSFSLFRKKMVSYEIVVQPPGETVLDASSVTA